MREIWPKEPGDRGSGALWHSEFHFSLITYKPNSLSRPVICYDHPAGLETPSLPTFVFIKFGAEHFVTTLAIETVTNTYMYICKWV